MRVIFIFGLLLDLSPWFWLCAPVLSRRYIFFFTFPEIQLEFACEGKRAGAQTASEWEGKRRENYAVCVCALWCCSAISGPAICRPAPGGRKNKVSAIYIVSWVSSGSLTQGVCDRKKKYAFYIRNFLLIFSSFSSWSVIWIWNFVLLGQLEIYTIMMTLALGTCASSQMVEQQQEIKRERAGRLRNSAIKVFRHGVYRRDVGKVREESSSYSHLAIGIHQCACWFVIVKHDRLWINQIVFGKERKRKRPPLYLGFESDSRL